MANIFNIALARQMNLANELNIIAHNIANMNTVAYKSEKLLFREFLEKSGPDEAYVTVQDHRTIRDTREGSLRRTNNPLDVAIQGDGYFAIQGAGGIRYSRQGQFSLDLDRNLVNSAGYQVLDDAQAAIVIPIEATDVTIAPDGTISSQIGILGQIGIFNFEDNQNIARVENGLYLTEQPPILNEAPVLLQGMLEESNVTPVLEMTDMMALLREHQRMKKVIDEQHELVKKMIDKVGGSRQ